MDAEEYNQRGLSHRAEGDEDAAYADFTECIRLITDEPAPFFNRALVELARGNLAEALLDFDRALLLNPREADALIHRASIRCQLGDFAGALDDCNRLVELYPAQSLAHLNRAIIRYNCGDLPSALDDCTDALAIDPKDSSALNLRGRILRGLGRSDEALVDFDCAIALASGDAEAYRERALTLRGRGDMSAALLDYREAIRLEGADCIGSTANFQAGQCWEYEAPSGEEASRIHVLSTEEIGAMGTVVHIAVSNLARGGVIGHLPMAASSLRSCVIRLDMACPVPDELDVSGIRMWHEAVAEGQSGAWANALREIIPALLAGMQGSRHGEEAAKELPSRWRFWKKWRSG